MKRAERLSTLALATPSELEETWSSFGEEPSFLWVTKPEFAATMVRGRIASDGPPFNLGEVGITRCVIQLKDPATVGVGYVIGRAKRRATLVALMDAITQQDGPAAETLRHAIGELPAKRQLRHQEKEKELAASRVDFSIASAGLSE
ncbi:alpha-D-ribose 1-methylphosphonate 5-triphosphate synthase subunit PhnG [Bradyrhizobium sp. CIR48]|uniref:phosphonate C-P lyase system protein PhnG n=1 Tax=Bradyrhizobium sp. CIR48 TaxID=2663840 RepID=UPI0016067987|nr:phosphonate C-P lyase system protein PhnG [Bradyrhizobium sp. CIR48]MBB4428302.1 alpha-D-ribose 1-methylphosphonate 5-triphosphate synthase subunit PhnG [Bradyrhizobium sp. CIR48]